MEKSNLQNIIRPATHGDICRMAEIFVFNNRQNYFPIFHDEYYSFKFLTVQSLMQELETALAQGGTFFVLDDGILRGYIKLNGTEVEKLYVDTFFQGKGYGSALLGFAIKNYGANRLWALEKNATALAFYKKHGFIPTGKTQLEDGTTEWLLELIRQ